MDRLPMARIAAINRLHFGQSAQIPGEVRTALTCRTTPIEPFLIREPLHKSEPSAVICLNILFGEGPRNRGNTSQPNPLE